MTSSRASWWTLKEAASYANVSGNNSRAGKQSRVKGVKTNGESCVADAAGQFTSKFEAVYRVHCALGNRVMAAVTQY
jgi:hypothetical protein